MPKATKKTVKKAIKPVMPETSTVMPATMPASSVAKKAMNGKVLGLALAVIVIGLLTYKVGPWVVPAIVNNHPITRFALWSRLEKSYGAQSLDDMINEKILDQAIAKAGVKIDQTKLNDQITSLEKQFESTGGLDEALKQRGLTRSDLTKQVSTQLAVEEILADKINPTDAEVQKAFDSGAKTTYKDKKIDDVRADITDSLKQAKLRDAFLAWFADIKKSANVKTFGL